MMICCFSHEARSEFESFEASQWLMSKWNSNWGSVDHLTRHYGKSEWGRPVGFDTLLQHVCVCWRAKHNLSVSGLVIESCVSERYVLSSIWSVEASATKQFRPKVLVLALLSRKGYNRMMPIYWTHCRFLASALFFDAFFLNLVLIVAWSLSFDSIGHAL